MYLNMDVHTDALEMNLLTKIRLAHISVIHSDEILNYHQQLETKFYPSINSPKINLDFLVLYNPIPSSTIFKYCI